MVNEGRPREFKDEFERITAKIATKDDFEKMEQRLRADIALHTAKFRRSLFVWAAIIVVSHKLLDFLFG